MTRGMGKELTLDLGDGVNIKFAYIPPGEFMMGSPENEAGRDEDEVQHRVRLTRPFYIGVTPVTQRQLLAVTYRDCSHFRGFDLPAERVKWTEAVGFCESLSAKEGKRCRLPTEAEWEYACRAGTMGSFGGTGHLDGMGWFAENSGDAYFDSVQIWDTGHANYQPRLIGNHCRTHPVGQKSENAWGLYDMHGNVFEWCHDLYGEYPAGAVVDPCGPPGGLDRVVRGGSWGNCPRSCRSARRLRNWPTDRSSSVGFRVVVEADVA